MFKKCIKKTEDAIKKDNNETSTNNTPSRQDTKKPITDTNDSVTGSSIICR